MAGNLPKQRKHSMRPRKQSCITTTRLRNDNLMDHYVFGTHPASTSTAETRGLVLVVMLVLSLLRVDRGSGIHGI